MVKKTFYNGQMLSGAFILSIGKQIGNSAVVSKRSLQEKIEGCKDLIVIGQAAVEIVTYFHKASRDICFSPLLNFLDFLNMLFDPLA
jgi:hypothetical protein